MTLSNGHMVQEPVLADFIETALDVPLEDQLRACVSQCVETLFDRISAGPLLTKPVRVSIRGGFHNWVKGEQMQCLLRSVLHCGNSERAHRFAV